MNINITSSMFYILNIPVRVLFHLNTEISFGKKIERPLFRLDGDYYTIGENNPHSVPESHSLN